MKIAANRLDRGFFLYQEEFEQRALEVLRSGWYVLGSQVKAFEEEFAAYVGASCCVGVANGLDALTLAFRALGVGAGDEVIVQANTYIASVMGASINGATPVFVEPDDFFGIDSEAIEQKITPRTKAVLAVHLYGQACRMDRLQEIVKKHGLYLVEDCAQSHGAFFDGKMTGTFGDIACFSFYPSKNLGAFGDGGAIVTDKKELAEEIAILRNYGSEKRYYNKVVGVNSRLDELQAGLLRVRLAHLNELSDERNRIAERYDKELDSTKYELPKRRERTNHVFHQYVIRTDRRQELMDYLNEKEIGTIIHYPIPPHLSEAYHYLGYKKGDFPLAEQLADEVLSIPMYNGMTDEEQDYVIEALNSFQK